MFKNKEELIQLISEVVEEATEHGGDAGGAYCSNPDDLVTSINDLLIYLELDDEYEADIIDEYGRVMIKNIWGDWFG